MEGGGVLEHENSMSKSTEVGPSGVSREEEADGDRYGGEWWGITVER